MEKRMLLKFPEGPKPFEATIVNLQLGKEEISFWVTEGNYIPVKKEWLKEISKKKITILLRDRKELVKRLLEMGYEPNNEGDFVKEDRYSGVSFLTSMWQYCGCEVKNGYIVKDDWEVSPEWTEEIEE